MKEYFGMKHMYYDVRFMFIDQYSGEGIELFEGEGVAKIVGEDRFYHSVKLFDLPNVGDIMKVRGSGLLWIVSCVIRRPELALDSFPSTATILLCDHNLYVDNYFPNLYVGLLVDDDPLVGVIGPDRIFKTLRGTKFSGFGWGYRGTGPVHLSESILLHHLGQMPDKDLVLDFERSLLAALDVSKPFIIESKQIDEWISLRKQD
jgi:hypothetical protein